MPWRPPEAGSLTQPWGRIVSRRRLPLYRYDIPKYYYRPHPHKAAVLPLPLALTIPALVYRSATGRSYNFNERGLTYLTQLDGLGMPPVINEAVQTPSRDGETYIRTVLEPRFLKPHFTITATTFALLQEERRRLIAILNPRLGMGRLEWTPVKGKTYGIDAIIETGADFADHPSAVVENLRLSFRCPDPAFNLQPIETTTFNVGGGLSVPWSQPMSIDLDSQQKTIHNEGDLPSYPTFTITGPLASPKVENLTTSKLVSLSGYDLLAGSTLVINMDAQTIKVDGVSKIGEMTAASEIWTLEPGSNEIKVSSTTGGGNYRMTFAARYLGV